MQALSPIGRKRPITACTECRRRKQKCDREKPCNMCIGRNVSEKCTYEYAGSSDEGSTSKPLHTPPSANTSGQSQASVTTTDHPILSQIGYGQSSERHTLTELYDLMGNDSALQALESTNRIFLSPQVLGKLSELSSMMPSQPITRALIDIYFSEANWYFAVLEKYYFERLYSSWWALSIESREAQQLTGLSQDLLCFPGLIFQVLAVALQFSPLGIPCIQALGIDSLAQRDSLSSELSERGMEITRVVGKHEPAITSIQNDLMRALWLKNCSRGREAWHILGDAIRMAQDLGIHRQVKVIQRPNTPIEETLELLWYDEYKRRLWIKLFSWDGHMAFTLGRPRAINTSDCTIMPPLDRDIPADPRTTIPTAVLLNEPPSSFTPHLFQYAICQQMHEVMSLGLHKRHLENYSHVKTIHESTLSLLNNLPPVHRPTNPDTSWDATHVHIPKQRQQIATAAHSFLVALHRPHSKTHVASREAAIEASLAVLDAQERLFDLMATQYSNIYALSVYTVDASIFLSVTALEFPTSDPTLEFRIYHAVEKARYRLESVKERISLANSGLQVLKLCQLKRKPSSQFDEVPFMNHQNGQPIGNTTFGDMQMDYTSASVLENPANFQVPSTMPMFDPSELDNAVIFDGMMESNFDIEAWVQQVGQMNGLEWT